MYGKVFRQMYKGSMSMVGWEAVVTMQQLIILADQHGVIDMTPQAIAGETTIPLEIIQKGLQLLAEPDPESRSPDEDGRRIVPLSPSRSWGWQLVNYAKYRAIRDEEERREYQRQYWHKRKTQPDSTRLNSTQPNSTHAEAEEEGKVKAEKKVPTEPCPAERDVVVVEAVFDHWKTVHDHPKAKLDAKRKRVIKAALSLYSVDELCESISGYLHSSHHMGENDKHTKYDDLGLLLRDAAHIDSGLNYARNPPTISLHSKLTQENIARTAGWVPPEMRNARN